MKELRLVFEKEDGKHADITLPMEKWISDWWFACEFVPRNDATILVAELDGKSVLNDILEKGQTDVEFEEVAYHFNWDGLYDDFYGTIKGPDFDNLHNGNVFEEWLGENVCGL